MKKVIEEYFCDICKEPAKYLQINYPVIFHTEQDEGRSVAPHICYEKLDMCHKCAENALMLHGWGAQGYNMYSFNEGGEG